MRVHTTAQPLKHPSDVLGQSRGQALYALALADAQNGNFERARSYAERALALCPGDAAIGALLRSPQAVAQAQLPSPVQQALAAASDAEAMGEFARAVHLLQQALRQNDDAALHHRIGILLAFKLADTTRATDALLRAVKLAPEHALYRQDLDRLLASANPTIEKKTLLSRLKAQVLGKG
jgi:tetratricopeptide (TPR) repeat protein